MGNWNRHFVRVGSDGNMGVYDQRGNRFIRENIGSDNLPARIAFIPSSGDTNGGLYPPEINAIELESGGASISRINPNSSYVLNLGRNDTGYLQYDFGQSLSLAHSGLVNEYDNINTAMKGLIAISGSPDLRTGITAADASAITIFSSTVSGTRYEIKARILATAGTSAVYTITWTEGGAARTVALTVSAVGTEYHENFVVAPDSGTNITAQITSLTSSTVNVDAIVSVLG